jgi:YVTN family beta-propeller protein/VCBS repeat-containing protein
MAKRRNSNLRGAKGRHRKATRDAEAYVHWLGAGAVTLGLGAAMATGSGIVLAAPASADDSASAESSSTDTGPESSPNEASSSDGPESGATSAPDKPTSTVSASTVEVSNDAETEQDSTDKDTDTDTDDPSTEPTAPPEPDETPSDDATPVVEDDTAAKPDAGAPPLIPETADPAVNDVGSDTGSDYSAGDAADTPVAVSNTTPDAGPVETLSAPTSSTSPGDDTTSIDAQAAVALPMASPVSTPVARAFAAPAAAQTTTPAFLTGPVTLRAMVSDVLTWLGLGQLATTLPIEPAPLPPLMESLWLVVRRFGYTFLNQTPAAQPTISGQNTLTGVITGELNATDYDDDHLTYTVTGAPAHGTVTVDAAGNFVYTPTAALAEAGGQDEFTVTIDDRPGNPWHIHGLLDVLGWVPNTTATVKVTVVPINHLPAVTITPTGQPNPTTGAITYQVQVTDPDPGDTPMVAVTDAPDHGTLVRNMDGTYTYTPDYEYAHDIPPGQTGSDSITITANDGRGGIDAETEQIAVPFLNAAPTVSTSVGNPDPQTGAMAGTVTGADADGDPLTYTVTSGPKGTVVFNQGTSSYTYTPTEAARLAAAAANATPADKQDTITITASDGYTQTTITVTVPITPLLNTVIDTIDVGGNATGVAVSPDGTRLYVAVAGTGVVVIDTNTNIVTPIGGLADYFAYDIVVSPDGSQIYVGGSDRTGQGRDAVFEISTASLAVTATVPFGILGSPQIVLSPDGRYVYAYNRRTDTVEVIDTVTDNITATISGFGLFDGGDLALSPGGTRMYVGAERAVKVVDIASNAIVGTIEIGAVVHGVEVSSDGQIYVNASTTAGSFVAVIHPATNTITATFPVAQAVSTLGPSLAISPDGDHLYALSFTDVTVIDTASGAVTTIDVDGSPSGVAVSPDGSHVYVTTGNSVSVIAVAP